MVAYLLLFIAIFAEIIGTSFLKFSNGFTRLLPSAIVCVSYTLSFYLLSLTLRTLPVSMVYAIWSGIGIIGIGIIGVIFFREPFGPFHFLGTFLILIGVIILNLVTRA